MPYVPEREYDNRQMMHSTPRYRGTVTCYASEDDDQAHASSVGGGLNLIHYKHEIGDPLTASLYFDLNTIDNVTYLYQGSMQWKDCQGDAWSASVVPKVTSITAGSNTNYTLYGGYLIIPAAGDGDYDLAGSPVLVQVGLNERGERSGAGYWDADYDPITGQFQNIAPNLTGEGEFNLFAAEVYLSRYVNRFILVGSSYGSDSLSSFDADMLGHNLRIKFEFETRGADHAWELGGHITLFRSKTT